MARKEATVTIAQSGRDDGKVFHIREWPATRAENWGLRMLGAVVASGGRLPEGAKEAGLAGVVMMGFESLFTMNVPAVIGLLDELMECVDIEPSLNVRRKLIEDDIEEVRTRLHLKQRVFELHTGFSFADLRERLISAAKTYLSSAALTSPPS